MTNQTLPPRPSSSGVARLLVIAALLLAIGVVAFAAMRWVGAEDLTNERSLAVLPVDVIEVQPVESIENERYFTGRVAAGRASALSFERTARLADAMADEGDSVRRGQPLGRLDTRDLELRKAQLDAQRLQAQARLDELRAGPRREAIDAAKARVSELERRLELAEFQRKRRGELLERQAISQEEFDRLDFESRALDSSLAAANAQLDELETGTRSEQVRAQEAVVKGLEAQVASLELDIEKSVLRAPFAGRIAERLIDEGVVVQPGQPVFRILEQGRPEVRIGLPPEAAQSISVGDKVTIEVAGVAYDAEATGVLPEIESETRTATALFDLPAAANDEVFAGQVARLQLSQQESASGYWLPMTALTPGVRGLWACYILVPSEQAAPDGRPAFELERVPVEVLHSTEQQALVRGVLKTGDRVVRDGVNRVTAGQLVRPSSGA